MGSQARPVRSSLRLEVAPWSIIGPRWIAFAIRRSDKDAPELKASAQTSHHEQNTEKARPRGGIVSGG
jgi:hypothetical protein